MKDPTSSMRTIEMRNVAWIVIGLVLHAASLSIAYQAWVSLAYVSGVILWAHRLVVVLALGIAVVNGAILVARIQIVLR